MASERQVQANRKNASRSTGPKTDEGKARSRANATKHGMAVESTEVEIGLSPAFLERRAKWGAEQKPNGEAAEWALDRAVAATLRIERCERTLDAYITVSSARATLAWDEDRAAEAARLGAKLADNPPLVTRELETSRAGAQWLIVAWLDLAATLEDGKDWSEPEFSRSLDLLGQPPEFRDGPAEGDPTDTRTARLELARHQVERLKELRDEALAPLDEMDRRMAIEGDIALLSKPAARILRYERDAWRRYRESMAVVQAGPPAPMPVLAPSPKSSARPIATEKSDPSTPSFEEQRRALKEEAAPFVQHVTDQLRAEGFVDEDAWLDELERRMEAWEVSRGFAAMPVSGRPDAGGRNEANFSADAGSVAVEPAGPENRPGGRRNEAN